MSFVMCKRNELLVSEILNKNPHAFVLLFFIAVRAWRGPGVSPRDCDIGEALIGDYSKMGMTEQKYRTAKKHLEKMGFITTKSTNKGTVAKLINTELFDPNFELGNEQINGQITSKQRAVNEQVTTNNNCKNLNNWNKREAAPLKIKIYLLNQYQNRWKSWNTAVDCLFRNGIANTITIKRRSNAHGKTLRGI